MSLCCACALVGKVLPASDLKISVWIFFYVRLNPAALLWSVAQITSYLNHKLYYARSFDLTGLSKSCELVFGLI